MLYPAERKIDIAGVYVVGDFHNEIGRLLLYACYIAISSQTCIVSCTYVYGVQINLNCRSEHGQYTTLECLKFSIRTRLYPVLGNKLLRRRLEDKKGLDLGLQHKSRSWEKCLGLGLVVDKKSGKFPDCLVAITTKHFDSNLVKTVIISLRLPSTGIVHHALHTLTHPIILWDEITEWLTVILWNIWCCMNSSGFEKKILVLVVLWKSLGLGFVVEGSRVCMIVYTWRRQALCEWWSESIPLDEFGAAGNELSVTGKGRTSLTAAVARTRHTIARRTFMSAYPAYNYPNNTTLRRLESNNYRLITNCSKQHDS